MFLFHRENDVGCRGTGEGGRVLGAGGGFERDGEDARNSSTEEKPGEKEKENNSK